MNKHIILKGCIIEDNTIYEVFNRSPKRGEVLPHYSDPRYDSVKEKMPGVGNTFSFATANNLYDTGFNENSEIFNQDKEVSNDWAKREKKAREYFKFIMEPLRGLILDIDQAKEPMNYEFFENEDLYKNFFKVNLYAGRVFNTSNPVDKLHLYISIITGNICMQGDRTEDEKKLGLKNENEVKDGNAQYSYASLKNNKTKAEVNVDTEMTAVFNFGSYLKEDKETLISILNSMDMGVKEDIEDIRLKSLFKIHILANLDKVKKFNSIVETYEKDPKTFTKIAEIEKKVNSPYARKVLFKDKNTWYMGETPLGSNKKSMIQTFNKDEALYQKFLNILDNQ